MRMLAKNPADRPPATEVDEILDSIVSLQAASRLATNGLVAQHGVIGREPELQSMREAFESDSRKA